MSEMLNNPFALTKSEIAIFGLGIDYEQERIIKLLSDAQKCTTDEDCHCRDCCNCSIIALIKGEK